MRIPSPIGLVIREVVLYITGTVAVDGAPREGVRVKGLALYALGQPQSGECEDGPWLELAFNETLSGSDGRFDLRLAGEPERVDNDNNEMQVCAFKRAPADSSTFRLVVKPDQWMRASNQADTLQVVWTCRPFSSTDPNTVMARGINPPHA